MTEQNWGILLFYPTSNNYLWVRGLRSLSSYSLGFSYCASRESICEVWRRRIAVQAWDWIVAETKLHCKSVNREERGKQYERISYLDPFVRLLKLREWLAIACLLNLNMATIFSCGISIVAIKHKTPTTKKTSKPRRWSRHIVCQYLKARLRPGIFELQWIVEIEVSESPRPGRAWEDLFVFAKPFLWWELIRNQKLLLKIRNLTGWVVL